jgi:hypothetical protein
MFAEGGTLDKLIGLLASASKKAIICKIDTNFGGHPFIQVDYMAVEIYFTLPHNSYKFLPFLSSPSLPSSPPYAPKDDLTRDAHQKPVDKDRVMLENKRRYDYGQQLL